MNGTYPDKHVWIAENLIANLENNSKLATHKNFQNLKTIPATKDIKLILCLMPCWGVYFPPYNLARLSAVARGAGYSTTVFDYNGSLYQKLKLMNLDDAWDSAKHWWWIGDNYYTKLHPILHPYLVTYIKQIININPDVVGFSLYGTNIEPTKWIIAELKKALPTIKIIVGGPACHELDFVPMAGVDHWVAGEGEQALIEILHNVENNIKMPIKLGETYSNTRLNLDTLPMPDYTDYDLSIYKTPNGVSAELSRGCVAQCSFCTETWFWKYRDRDSHTVLDEVEFQTKTYNVKTIWFIDSLVNGNLKELRSFARGVVERNLDIRWMGYARCDGRMNLEYFRDLKNSGCEHLSFGVESGSQKVLDLMNKKITLDAVNKNLKDCKKSNIMVLVNWIVGFPNEDSIAAAHGLTLIWNHRNNIRVISPGMTFGDNTQSDFGFNRQRYDVSPYENKFEGWWWSLNWTNSKPVRLIRLKLLNIWLNLCKDHGDYILNSQHRPNLSKFYTIEFDNSFNTNNTVVNEEFDFNIINTDLGPFADSIVNEVWNFLRMVWLVKGSFKFNIVANKQIDHDEFGSVLACDNHEYTIQFEIDDTGNFAGTFTHKLVHPGEPWMTGTKSFNFTWSGAGYWARNIMQATITSQTQSGWADECVETVSTETRIKNKSLLEQREKEKKYIPIVTSCS